MAIELSETLKKFKESYDSANPESANGLASTLSGKLASIVSNLQTAAGDFNSSGSDDVIKNLVSCTDLAAQAVDRVQKHVDTDVSSIVNGLKTVRDDIGKIEEEIKDLEAAKQKANENYKAAYEAYEKESETNPAAKAPVKPSFEKEEETIDNHIKKGEAQIAAISAAADGISLGIQGNMVLGGALGADLKYDDNYNFTWEEPAKEGTEEDKPGEDKDEDKKDEDKKDEDKKDEKKGKEKYADAKEFDEVEIPKHNGKSKVISIPRNNRELKDAMHNGQPIILENSTLLVDTGGVGFNKYDATRGRIYLVQCEDGYYRQIDEYGEYVDKNQKIDPDRIYGASDDLDEIITGTSWNNDTALEYKGKQRETKKPEQTGTTVTDITKAKKGDAFEGKKANGNDIHSGSSNVVADPQDMVEFKKAVANGQPIRLDGVKLIYDSKGNQRVVYDATTNPIYLVQDSLGNYRAVDGSGEALVEFNPFPIDPKVIANAGDNGKYSIITSELLNDTVFQKWVNGKLVE